MRIGIVGHFGGKKNFTDGQTVKIKSLYNALQKYVQNVKIDKIDTYYIKSNPLKFIVDLLKCIAFDSKIIFFPAHRGKKIFFPFFYYIKLIFNKEVFHDCIAGNLDKELRYNKSWKKYLTKFDSNWMESPEQVEKLIKMGVSNCIYVPNFKNIQSVSLEEVRKNRYDLPLRFCIFSRVEPMKGIEDALIAMQKINKNKEKCAELDIYGPIQPGYEDWFETIKQKYEGLFQYKGVIEPNQSVECLKHYFALIFPTRYFTEGMPGTIIDAMFSGLPVIARKWAWCDNMLKNGYNGIVYEFDKPELLNDIIENICCNPEIILKMKENCILESEKYSDKRIVNDIIKIMKI